MNAAKISDISDIADWYTEPYVSKATQNSHQMRGIPLCMFQKKPQPNVVLENATALTRAPFVVIVNIWILHSTLYFLHSQSKNKSLYILKKRNEKITQRRQIYYDRSFLVCACDSHFFLILCVRTFECSSAAPHRCKAKFTEHCDKRE